MIIVLMILRCYCYCRGLFIYWLEKQSVNRQLVRVEGPVPSWLIIKKNMASSNQRESGKTHNVITCKDVVTRSRWWFKSTQKCLCGWTKTDRVSKTLNSVVCFNPSFYSLHNCCPFKWRAHTIAFAWARQRVLQPPFHSFQEKKHIKSIKKTMFSLSRKYIYFRFRHNTDILFSFTGWFNILIFFNLLGRTFTKSVKYFVWLLNYCLIHLFHFNFLLLFFHWNNQKEKCYRAIIKIKPSERQTRW